MQLDCSYMFISLSCLSSKLMQISRQFRPITADGNNPLPDPMLSSQ